MTRDGCRPRIRYVGVPLIFRVPKETRLVIADNEGAQSNDEKTYLLRIDRGGGYGPSAPILSYGIFYEVGINSRSARRRKLDGIRSQMGGYGDGEGEGVWDTELGMFAEERARYGRLLRR